jgi:hypothetical protein
MAYIVDLVIIMQMIFIISESRADGIVKPREVEDVLKRFEADLRRDVHRDIKEFVEEMGVFNAIMRKDIVFEKIVNLIDHHRVRGEEST